VCLKTCRVARDGKRTLRLLAAYVLEKYDGKRKTKAKTRKEEKHFAHA